MADDGSRKFYRLLDVDKQTKKLLYAFRYLKTKMMKGKDEYSNGIVLRDEGTDVR